MTGKLTCAQRAVELALGGTCETVADIRRQLEVEGYALADIDDKSTARQLRDLIASADRTARPFRPK